MQVRSDLAWTTLTAGYTAGGGSLTVASSTTGSGPKAFPATGSFRVAITNPVANSPVKCLLEVTAVPDSTHFTTTSSDSLDANCSNGDWVFEVETASSMQSLLAEYDQIGTYASLPGTAKNGWRYKANDAPQEFVYSGGVWNAFFNGYPAGDPTALSPSWNPSQGGATTTSTKGTVYVTSPTSGSIDMRAQVVSVPSTPYTRTALVYPIIQATNYGSCGICVSDGTKFEVIGLIYNAGFQVHAEKYTNATTSAGAPTYTNLVLNPVGPYWLRISDDGANRTYSMSFDSVNFYQIWTTGHSTFLTPTQIGWYVNSNLSNKSVAMSIAAWG